MKDEALMNMIQSEGFDKSLFLHYLIKTSGNPDI